MVSGVLSSVAVMVTILVDRSRGKQTKRVENDSEQMLYNVVAFAVRKSMSGVAVVSMQHRRNVMSMEEQVIE